MQNNKHSPSTLAKVYLSAYNISQIGGWGYILYKTLKLSFDHHNKPKETIKGKEQTYQRIWPQTSGLMESLHCLLGLVPGSPTTPLQQSVGRMCVAYGVNDFVSHSPLNASLNVAWSVADIIRYAFYVTSLWDITPQWLTYLRYTAFLLLYPVGMASEVGLVLTALYKGRGVPQENPLAYKAFALFFFAVIVGKGYPKVLRHMLALRRAKL
ncbi:very-long-chain CoA dehydratase [Acrasis kona]|uniref:very-long-chain (3R)-3-hydroxyacyl-CoA dehydratase n=1 Tax=Acrasis kona TaxID=1008807 RepID=A0AAW2ZRB2_9EUKA